MRYYDLITINNLVTYAEKMVNRGQIEIRRDGPYIWFGEYPQTIATSKAVAAMGTTPDSKGYYTSSYDNERYAKVVATPFYDSEYTFSDSTTVNSSSTYYFKVEPIKWRILSESDGKALILCESIIANKRFNEYYEGAIEGVYANNYAESEIRAWLNDQFYNIAFNKLQKSLIQTTEVDNSVYSTGSDPMYITGSDPNPYTCENTFDKIFLPSYREVTNTAYGFINDTDRYKVTSDYSRANGADTYTGDSYSGTGFWWLRSSYYYYSYYARCVDYEGCSYDHDPVSSTDCGVVPALTISLDENISGILLEKNIEEAGEVNGEGVFHIGQERTISATTNEGFTWLGWYDGETKVSTDDEMTYTFTASRSDRIFVAKWEGYQGHLSFDPNGGTGTMYSRTIRSGDTLPTNIFTNEGLYFAGWAKSAEGEVEYTEEDTYIVEENEGSYTLYAVWTSYPRFGSYIYFGEYPQTIATSKAVATMGTTPDSKGYYTSSYDNERYAKVVATPYKSGYTFSDYTFSDSTTVISSSTYYFKVEPIKWRILSESDGKALILCESIIANKRFAYSRNNYAKSEVRAWLNDQFYNIAFNELQKSLIQTTEVDNSVYSTGFSTNPYACVNTNDKIFLPSYREVMNPAYGFRNNTDRYKVTSDYSRATGAYTSTDDRYSGNGSWWLRSADNDASFYGRGVYLDGRVYSNLFVFRNDYCGLVPALTISLYENFSDILLEKNIEEAGEVNGEGVFHFGQERTISATTNEGFTWLGWYDGETKVSTDDEMTYTFTVSRSYRTFVAKWEGYQGHLSFDPNGGTGTIYSSTIRSGDTLPTNSFTNEGLYFAGWAKSAEGEVEYTEEDTYIVEENEGSYTLYAVWTSYPRFGSYIYFGEYPQTIATSEAVAAMGTTPDSNGYYTSSYDNERYAKVVATPYTSGYTFSDSTTVNSSSTYYFKVEPIKWRILSESDGKALILCESIIANKRYNERYSGAIEGVYANNYAESEVRAWLNDQFYNIAFSELQKSLIQTTEVDNSVDSTGFSTNPYACVNTNDKIFLPSYIEVMNTAYGFRNNTDRYKVTSDYSRATGAYTSTGDSYSGNGYWWLRSPYYCVLSNLARNVSIGGYVFIHYVDYTYDGLVPALTISLA